MKTAVAIVVGILVGLGLAILVARSGRTPALNLLVGSEASARLGRGNHRVGKIIIDQQCRASQDPEIHVQPRDHVWWDVVSRCAAAEGQPIGIAFDDGTPDGGTLRSGGQPGACACQATIRRGAATLHLLVKPHNVKTTYDFHVSWGRNREHSLDPRLEIDP